MSKQTQFQLEENSKRSGVLRKNVELEDKILAMNNVLEANESHEHSNVERPTLLVAGLPRSGTSLLYQCLASTLDIGYVNNIIARFWKAPVYGIHL